MMAGLCLRSLPKLNLLKVYLGVPLFNTAALKKWVLSNNQIFSHSDLDVAMLRGVLLSTVRKPGIARQRKHWSCVLKLLDQ